MYIPGFYIFIYWWAVGLQLWIKLQWTWGCRYLFKIQVVSLSACPRWSPSQVWGHCGGEFPTINEKWDKCQSNLSPWIEMVKTQYKIQMIYYRIVYLKPINFINHCHPNRFNLKKGKISLHSAIPVTIPWAPALPSFANSCSIECGGGFYQVWKVEEE